MTFILQQLKRRFDQTFNQAQANEDFEERSPNKTARSDEDQQRTELTPAYQQGNVINNLPRNIQIKTDPNELALGPTSLPQPKSEDVGTTIPQRNSHAQEQKGEIMEETKALDGLAEEKPHPGNKNNPIVSANCHANQQANTAPVKSDSLEHSSEFPPDSNRTDSNSLKNGISHIPNDGHLTDMLKDWENDFDEIFPNISDANPTTSSESVPPNSNTKSVAPATKTKERKESKNNNNNNVNSHPLSHSNPFPMASGIQQQNNLGSAPPYPNTVASGQMRGQAPAPMGIGPQIRRYLVDHIQGRGKQQMGPGSFGNMGGMPIRDSVVTNSQTKNPETIAKVQEHLMIKKQMQQRQMQMVRHQMQQQQLQQPYQQQTYQQQLIQMAQAAQQQQQPQPPSPMLQAMSPHIQQQAFMQQNMTSPVPSPMNSTTHMPRNPFQFPHDYNAYMNQQKQMQAFEGMGNMQSPQENDSQMGMNFFPGPKQEPSPYPVRQAMPSQSNMHPSGMQPNAIRGMFQRDRGFPADGMPHGQMMQGHLGPPQNFQPQVPKPPPPQYMQNNFSPPASSLERQQLQRSMSNARNRLSHFSHPDEMQTANPQSNPVVKSPGSLPMYQGQGGDNSMFTPMGGNMPSIGNATPQRNNHLTLSQQLSDNSFNNYGQNYGPPNMNIASPMSSANSSLSPSNWAEEGQMQKQHLQQMRMNMNPEYRQPISKGPSINLSSSRQMSMEQNRRMPAPFSPPVEKISTDGAQLPGSTVPAQPQKAPRVSASNSFKMQQTSAQDNMRLSQVPNESDDLESLLSDPPENFDLVKNLLG